MVRVGALLDQQLRDLLVAVLSGNEQQSVPEVVHLVQVEVFSLIRVQVRRPKVLHVRRFDQLAVEALVRQVVEGFLELLVLGVPDPADELVQHERWSMCGWVGCVFVG